MRELLYKEMKLSLHPTVYIFLLLDALLLVPSYPYYVAFIYTCLSVFFIFLTGRENKDVFFTVSLPVRKRDAVKARTITIAIIELVQILAAVPFAFLSNLINPAGNSVGIDANIALFGFVFIMYALFNLTFLPMFYKTAYKVGGPLAISGTVIGVYIVAMEVAIHIVPALKKVLDKADPAFAAIQLCVLAAGVAVFVLLTLLAYRMAAARFEKLDL